MGKKKVKTLDDQYVVGLVYASESAYNDVLALRAAWASFRDEIFHLSYYPQEGMTIEKIDQIRQLLSVNNSKDTIENKEGTKAK